MTPSSSERIAIAGQGFFAVHALRFLHRSKSQASLCT